MKKFVLKAKKSLFICQLSEDTLKVVKFLAQRNGKREIADLEIAKISPEKGDKTLTEEIGGALKKMGYNRSPIIISLPRASATSRYVKIPSQSAQEIEKILVLQAPRYLPYPANELITAYQVISTDKEGYSNANLIIAHKSTIQRYLDMLKPLAPVKIKIILSSYGLVNLCAAYAGQAKDEAFIITEIENTQVEFAVIEKSKIIFTRVFKFSRVREGWQQSLIEEINKSKDAFLKEIGKVSPDKVLVTGVSTLCQEFAGLLTKEAGLQAQVLSLSWLSQRIQDKILAADVSFAGLIGLGLKDIPESLNIIPEELKEAAQTSARRSEFVRYAAFIAGIIFIFTLGLYRNLSNKEIYLGKLKQELDRISQEARPLEEVETRLRMIASRQERKFSILDLLYEVRKNMPEQVSLVNFAYEEDKQITLRGQAAQLSPVFEFVSRLKNGQGFNNFNLKVRYATKRASLSGEVIDFEIACLKK